MKKIRGLLILSVFWLSVGTKAFADSGHSCQEEQRLPLCSEGYHSHCCPEDEGPSVQCTGNYVPVQADDGHWTCVRIPSGGR
jgi:hypothetical protein